MPHGILNQKKGSSGIYIHHEVPMFNCRILNSAAVGESRGVYQTVDYAEYRYSVRNNPATVLLKLEISPDEPASRAGGFDVRPGSFTVLSVSTANQDTVSPLCRQIKRDCSPKTLCPPGNDVVAPGKWLIVLFHKKLTIPTFQLS